MGQEYFINSQQLESKIRSLLPSQGGAGAGFDLSASTQIIPVVDLTESAEGSNLRQDLQTAISHANATSFNILNNSVVIINTTGYWQVQGAVAACNFTTADGEAALSLYDGTTFKTLFNTKTITSAATQFFGFYIPPFIIKLEAGDELRGFADTATRLSGTVNQIADINGNLT